MERCAHVCARHHPEVREESAPPEIEAVVEDIQRLLRGERRDLSAVALDMSAVPDFDRRVYVETRSIPPGETLTYGDIASRLGDSDLSRGVGQALGRNPFAIIVPCHRVLAAGGKSGGFSARSAASRPSGACWRSKGPARCIQRCPGIASADSRMPRLSRTGPGAPAACAGCRTTEHHRARDSGRSSCFGRTCERAANR